MTDLVKIQEPGWAWEVFWIGVATEDVVAIVMATMIIIIVIKVVAVVVK